MLQPIDILVAVKLAVAERDMTYAELASELGVSASQVHRAVRKGQASGLVREGKPAANPQALAEFLVHAVKYLLPAVRGGRSRGLPTAHSAPPLKDLLVGGDDDLVWPDPEGDIRGESLEPFHKQVPYAAKRDTELYKVLAAVDGIRAGRARERTLAAKYLKERIDANRA